MPPYPLPPGGFNPHPPLLAGETPSWPPTATASRGFNPHPPLLAGETLRCRRRFWRSFCFNPHPPLLAGETGKGDNYAGTLYVSIHTRHYWRVKRGGQRSYGRDAWFQSTPAITGG